ncbi:hypothetical protein FHS63_004664 [Azospirillum doebereinerae]
MNPKGQRSNNALAETINGLNETEGIRRRRPWRTLEAVEFATLEWVDGFNNRRRLEPIGNILPAEAELFPRAPKFKRSILTKMADSQSRRCENRASKGDLQPLVKNILLMEPKEWQFSGVVSGPIR